MDKINELVTWLMLVVGCWVMKAEAKGEVGRNEPELAHAAGSATPESPVQKASEYSHQHYIMSAGLSELLNKRRMKRNMGRRKEDAHAAK